MHTKKNIAIDAPSSLSTGVSTIGERIREAREAVGISQFELGARANIQPSAISRYEADKVTPRSDALARIAKVLRCDAGWLLTGEEPEDASAETRPPDPNFLRFLETKAAAGMTEVEKAALRAAYFSTGTSMKVSDYRSILAGVRMAAQMSSE